MNRAIVMGAAAAIVAAAGVVLHAGVIDPIKAIDHFPVSPAAAGEAGAAVYYQDPDGKPLYSATPKTTADGRAWRGVPASADVNFDEDDAPKQAAAQGERKIKYYRNPMGLPDVSQVPKKDSMGMDYIPVYEGEDSDDGSVTLSAGKIQRTGVQTKKVMLQPVRSIIRAPGVIKQDERRVSVVALRFEGFVETIADVTTGSHVRKGQQLATIYSPMLSSAAAEYLSALNIGASGKELKGARRRLENLGMAEASIKEIDRSREIALAIPWLAPQDGEILERNTVPGMRAGPGEVLFKIADHHLLWAVIDVAERDLTQIAKGTKVTIRPRALPGQSFTGDVTLIYPHLNMQTRTASIRIEIANPDGVLRPEMYVDAEVAVGSPDPVLTVPESAVLDSGVRQAVLVDKGEGRFEPREVALGRHGGGLVEITKGVSEGEAVATSANFLIDAESNLKAALQSFAAGTDSQAMDKDARP